MKVTDFNKLITKKQKGKLVDIAQIGEQTRIIRDILKQKSGIDIYEVIHKISK